jgi:hypothetical protein
MPDRSPAAPPAPPPSTRRRTSTARRAIGRRGSIAWGPFVILTLTVACGGGTASPPASASATASASAVTSAPPPASSSTVPDPDAGAALEAFRSFAQTSQSFHLTGDLLMSVGDVTLQAAITSDVSEGNEQGTIDLRGPGVSVRLSIVLLDGTVYLRLANRPWEAVAGGAGFSNPLAGLHVEGLQPIDIVNVGGVKTQHLRAEDPEGLNGQTLSGNTLTDLTIQRSSLDVYVTPDGVPLTAIVEFSGRGSFNGTEGPVTARIRYDFSNFGQDVEIVAPIVASPSPSLSP